MSASMGGTAATAGGTKMKIKLKTKLKKWLPGAGQQQ
jgi:hypothetical protein